MKKKLSGPGHPGGLTLVEVIIATLVMAFVTKQAKSVVNTFFRDNK